MSNKTLVNIQYKNEKLLILMHITIFRLLKKPKQKEAPGYPLSIKNDPIESLEAIRSLLCRFDGLGS